MAVNGDFFRGFRSMYPIEFIGKISSENLVAFPMNDASNDHLPVHSELRAMWT